MRRPPLHGDLSAGDHRRGQERRGVGQVGFDGDVLAADGARRHDPLADGRTLDVHAAVSECIDGHVDVRHARQPIAGVHQVQADVEAGCGQQEAGDELARRAGVDRDLAPAHVPVAAHRERQ